jgi:O-antigen/teichoic acid export membrane protein
VLRAVAPSTFRQGSLRLNLVFTLVGNTVQLGAQWATVMLLAKIGDPVMVGEFSLALGLCAPVITVLSLGLRTVLVTDAARSHTYADMLGARVIGTALALVVVTAEALWIARSPRVLAVYVLVAAARCIDSLSDIHWAQLQRAERMDLIAGSQALRGLLGITAMGAALALTRSLAWAAAALLAVSLLVWWRFDLRAVDAATPDERTRPTFDPAALRKIVKVTAPLVFSMALTAFAGPMPRYFLEAYRGTREVGYLAVASAPIALVGFLPSAIYQATAARAAAHMQRGEHGAFVALGWRVVAANVAVAMGFYLGSVLLGGVFLRVMFAPEYARLWPVMNLYCLSQVITTVGVFGSQVVNAGRMFRASAVLALLAVVAHLLASMALVPRYGLWGSVYADMVFKSVSAVVLFVIGAWWFVRERRTASVAR